MSLQNHILEASKKKIEKINICQTSNECHRIFLGHCRFLVALQFDIHLLDTLGQKRHVACDEMIRRTDFNEHRALNSIGQLTGTCFSIKG